MPPCHHVNVRPAERIILETLGVDGPVFGLTRFGDAVGVE